MCSECEGKFASSQALTAHLAQCHGELEPEQAFAASIRSSFYLMQPDEDILGDQHEGEAAVGSSQESSTQQNGEGEPGMEELEESQVADEEKEPLRPQCEGQKEEKTATEEAKKTERSQGALQVVLSPGAGEAELAASDGPDPQSEMVSN